MLARLTASAFLLRVSKHLALLACLLILAQASRRYEVGQLSIVGLAVLSAALHLASRALQRGLARQSR
jgi:hypothetical protein